MECTIAVEGIECYAYHGCLEEEARIGGNYSVDVYIRKDVSKSFKSDELKDTVDYGMVSRIVRKEMSVRSKLIEHAAGRILNALSGKINEYEKITVRITKHNPPVDGKVQKATIEVTIP